ncbi:MAG: YlcI/YnfO family protein [Acidimicrobiales bacterium]|jgi:hypothetical protein
MQLSNTIEGLQEDLSQLAGLGEGAVAEAASRLAGALVGPATVRLLDLLGQAAAELGEQLPNGRVELRISGREADLVYVEEAGGPADPEPVENQSARISLRLPEQLKAEVEQAAARDGVSVNTWIVRALGRSASAGRPTRSHKRLSGYGWA